MAVEQSGPTEKSLQHAFGTNFLEFMVYSNPTWDYHTFSVDHDMKVADDSMAARVDDMVVPRLWGRSNGCAPANPSVP
jgi:hypothetical protein